MRDDIVASDDDPAVAQHRHGIGITTYAPDRDEAANRTAAGLLKPEKTTAKVGCHLDPSVNRDGSATGCGLEIGIVEQPGRDGFHLGNGRERINRGVHPLNELATKAHAIGNDQCAEQCPLHCENVAERVLLGKSPHFGHALCPLLNEGEALPERHGVDGKNNLSLGHSSPQLSEMWFAGIVLGMDEPKSIELEPGDHRPNFTGPLARPKVLWNGVFWFGLASLGGAYASWQIGTWWAALLPIPGAVWVGMGLVGLFPRFWYGKAD